MANHNNHPNLNLTYDFTETARYLNRECDIQSFIEDIYTSALNIGLVFTIDDICITGPMISEAQAVALRLLDFFKTIQVVEHPKA